MLAVQLKIDKAQDLETIPGFLDRMPQPGQLLTLKTEDGAQLSFGRVVNLKSVGDILLVQSQFLVLEIWFTKYLLPIQKSSSI